MARAIHRETLEYLDSVHTPDYPTKDWIIDPNMAFVTGVPKQYWKIVGDQVLEMDSAEKEEVAGRVTETPIGEYYSSDEIQHTATAYKALPEVELFLNPGEYKIFFIAAYSASRNNADIHFGITTENNDTIRGELALTTGGSQNARAFIPIITIATVTLDKAEKILIKSKVSVGTVYIRNINLSSIQIATRS